MLSSRRAQVMDELASINALYSESKAELEGAKADQQELNELREMKEDIARKEKQQAQIIEHQVRDRQRVGLDTRVFRVLFENRGPGLGPFCCRRCACPKRPVFLSRSQAKRLEELEKLYKEEQVTRKRYFNQVCWIS